MGAEPTQDPFLTQIYDRRHTSALQQRLRRIAPLPVGVVYIQRPGEAEPEIRAQLRTMKRLGFNALEDILPVPGWSRERIGRLALDEGIIPWWYGEGGWEDITPGLLRQLGLSETSSMASVRADPRMVSHQMGVLGRRLTRTEDYVRQHGRGPAESVPGDVREFEGIGPNLPEANHPAYLAWVRKRYTTVERLNRAYNQHHAGLQPSGGQPFQSWDDFDARWRQQDPREYLHIRDQLRFKADLRLDRIRGRMAELRAFDPTSPFRAGGELSMLLPAAYHGIDQEGMARLMTEAGSFAPSIRPFWRLRESKHEVVRPVYMQASLATDLFKGGWVITWDSTGGPQLFDVGNAVEGSTVDENTMTQLLLSSLAAGSKGFGFWCWSARSAGKEAGESSLLDRHNQVTPRAIRAGQIGLAARRYRDELWRAHKEPVVGVCLDWENDALWATMSANGHDALRQRPVEARIGVSRALINAGVPFEYVTAADLRAGLGRRYPVLCLPSIVMLPKDILDLLGTFVEQGGRLVMDLPSAWYDEQAGLLSSERGSAFERIFGAVINEFQFAGTNRPEQLAGLDLQGFLVDLTPTHARVVARYAGGKPAITEAKTGEGSAIILGYEAARACFQPGNGVAESELIRYLLGNITVPFACRGALAYRLAAPEADHFFLINDGPATQAALSTGSLPYARFTDAVTGETLLRGRPIAVEANSGRWVRAEKQIQPP